MCARVCGSEPRLISTVGCRWEIEVAPLPHTPLNAAPTGSSGDLDGPLCACAVGGVRVLVREASPNLAVPSWVGARGVDGKTRVRLLLRSPCP